MDELTYPHDKIAKLEAKIEDLEGNLTEEETIALLRLTIAKVDRLQKKLELAESWLGGDGWEGYAEELEKL